MVLTKKKEAKEKVKQDKVFIVIAAYNEGKSIIKVISKLRSNGYHNIVVVDDGSRDNTYELAKKTGVIVLKHFINRGQGAALKTGIDFSVEKGADYIVTFDADGQHQAEEIKDLLVAVKKPGIEAALGSRFLKSTNIPFSRKFVLKAGILVTWIFYGLRLTDSHNGFRALSRYAAKKIDITSDRMEHASQIVEEINKKHIPFVEVPVTITYSDYSLSKGQSALNSINIGLKMIFRKLTR